MSQIVRQAPYLPCFIEAGAEETFYQQGVCGCGAYAVWVNRNCKGKWNAERRLNTRFNAPFIILGSIIFRMLPSHQTFLLNCYFFRQNTVNNLTKYIVFILFNFIKIAICTFHSMFFCLFECFFIHFAWY